MNIELQALIQSTDNGQKLAIAIVERCIHIMMNESFVYSGDIYHEMSFDEIVQKLRDEFNNG